MRNTIGLILFKLTFCVAATVSHVYWIIVMTVAEALFEAYCVCVCVCTFVHYACLNAINMF